MGRNSFAGSPLDGTARTVASSVLRTFICMVAAMSFLGCMALLAHQGRLAGLPGRGLFAGFCLGAALALRKLPFRALWEGKSKSIAVLVAASGVTYGAAVTFAYFFQNLLLFAPVPGDFMNCPELKRLHYEFFDRTVDGLRVRAYLHREPRARGWLLIFHGNAESACKGTEYTRNLADLGLNFALVEYPGYRGDGSPLTEEVYLKNAEAAYNFIRAEATNMPLFILGRSFGTAIATAVGANHEVAGLVLISPFTSIQELAPHAFPFLPASLLPRKLFAAEEWAKQVSAPALVVHGSSDRLIPASMGHRQAKNFRHLVSYVEIENADHNSIVEEQGGEAWKVIRAFLAGIGR